MTLFDECKKFREAIKKCDNYYDYRMFNAFPHGCCGITSEILGKYLHDNGYGEFNYICGKIPEEGKMPLTHAWLEQNDIIIDITADQFESVIETVIVICKSESEFHKQFEIDFSHKCNYDLDFKNYGKMINLYNKIIKYI